jgi:hypothetical protein
MPHISINSSAIVEEFHRGQTSLIEIAAAAMIQHA